jgi:signal transduction histidine kinase
MNRRAPAARFGKARTYRWLIVLGGALLASGLMIFTQVLIEHVRSSAKGYLTRTVEVYRDLLLRGDAELAYDAVQGIDFPMVLTDEDHNPLSWRNLTLSTAVDSAQLIDEVRGYLRQFDQQGNEPIEVEILPGRKNYFHYGDPRMVSLLRGLSLFSVIAVALYIFLSFVGYRSIREAETRSVWVGMARETAHQLGTPISSLLGWLEVIEDAEGSARKEASAAMRQDVARLEKIAVRFSKIGAKEKLQPLPVREVVKEAVRYMKTRMGTAIKVEITGDDAGKANIQAELIGWVLENLLRNAAQAMGGEGRIEVRLYRDHDAVIIDVADEGVGIASRDHESIFRPGFTTKSRGWGLGLSLARRIVGETHRGRLYVHESRPGEGTTIRMVLPSE